MNANAMQCTIRGRKDMTADQKREHLRTCTNPQCVRLAALYRKVAEYVRDNIEKQEGRRR